MTWNDMLMLAIYTSLFGAIWSFFPWMSTRRLLGQINSAQDPQALEMLRSLEQQRARTLAISFIGNIATAVLFMVIAWLRMR